ncbi:Uncharacterized protein Fot_31883 [Forsythia ovata]|uniref:Uncharacterized protein n=1 Tax=Forsythia ovata TaxID=205694 RepID=A0ABD1T676_9LAMI
MVKGVLGPPLSSAKCIDFRSSNVEDQIFQKKEHHRNYFLGERSFCLLFVLQIFASLLSEIKISLDVKHSSVISFSPLYPAVTEVVGSAATGSIKQQNSSETQKGLRKRILITTKLGQSITQEPGPVKGGNTVIAFVEHPVVDDLIPVELLSFFLIELCLVEYEMLKYQL